MNAIPFPDPADHALSSAELIVRPIEPDDKRALAEGFARLGAASRYRRFLSPHNQLTEEELRYFTEVDHHDHEALVAIDPRTGAGVGVARYVRDPSDPTQAELAVAVVDDWQRQGVGTRLVLALAARARQEGIATFTAQVLAENQLMLNLAEDLGDVRVCGREFGTVELRVDLPQSGPARLSRILRAAAAGDLRLASLRHHAG